MYMKPFVSLETFFSILDGPRAFLQICLTSVMLKYCVCLAFRFHIAGIDCQISTSNALEYHPYIDEHLGAALYIVQQFAEIFIEKLGIVYSLIG